MGGIKRGRFRKKSNEHFVSRVLIVCAQGQDRAQGQGAPCPCAGCPERSPLPLWFQLKFYAGQMGIATKCGADVTYHQTARLRIVDTVIKLGAE